MKQFLWERFFNVSIFIYVTSQDDQKRQFRNALQLGMGHRNDAVGISILDIPVTVEIQQCDPLTFANEPAKYIGLDFLHSVVVHGKCSLA